MVHLGGYPTHQDVAEMSNLFYFYSVYMINGGDALTEISFFEAKWDEKNRYKHFRQPVETKLMQMGMY